MPKQFQKLIQMDPTFSGIPITPDSFLSLRFFGLEASLTIRIQITAKNFEGNIITTNNTFTLSAANAKEKTSIRLGYDFLLSVVISGNDAADSLGTMYVQCYLQNGVFDSNNPRQLTLIEGYVASAHSLCWPPPQNGLLGLDPWVPKIITISNPAAGADFSYTIPDYTQLELLYVSYLLTADATVTNRRPGILFSDGTTSLKPYYSTTQITANQARTLSFFLFGHTNTSSFSNNIYTSLPYTLLLSGWTIESTTNTIQAGDQISAIQLYVRQRAYPQKST